MKRYKDELYIKDFLYQFRFTVHQGNTVIF